MKHTVAMELTSCLALVDRLHEQLQAVGTKMGWSAEQVFGLKLATSEAFSNVVRHGYHGECDAPIEVVFEAQADGIEICIRDQGCPFCLQEQTVHLVDPWSVGGRGIFLIFSLMDGARSERIGDWNELRMWKKFNNTNKSSGCA
ncbi:ATP-binding protein [Heliophilum fasciatum]|uniref:Serine/threonine-protein kinase RsbW n=1 Tax=Heliophilum fasciatum TaxID=35700 RepID=A0A4R2RSM9_9FIRM|nr:ATP-binding protein [Heliophilum fasciatum]MCW2277424.1 serine/threonine-protein kinase RsbW [Heliophilum fasciatum]TCP67260.1 serine/threonine-protein kinase RsbW [Heliophilum fasciatum]